MSRTIATTLAAGLLFGAGTGDPHDAPHVVFVTGDDEYRSEVSMPMIAGILEKRHGLETTVLYSTEPDGRRNPKYHGSIPGLEALRDANLAVFFLRYREVPDGELAAILDYVRSGKPLVGFRTTTHAFQYRDPPNARWNDGFGAEFFGQKWITHHGHTSTTAVSVIPETASHPILRGVEKEFSVASWLYHVTPLVGDCVPLLRGRAVNSEQAKSFDRFPPVQPVAWTKSGPKGARVFFTTLGHPADFEREPMRRLAVNAILWALGREESIPPEGADATPAAPYSAPPTH